MASAASAVSKRLFVTRLPFAWRKENVAKFFGQFGKVSDTVVISDRVTLRSKGYGFVTFADEAVANKVLESSEFIVEGSRKIAVAEAKRPPHVSRVSDSPAFHDYGFKGFLSSK